MDSFQLRDDGFQAHGLLKCGTWNIRGLTELKLFELFIHMLKYSIDILCIQETWKKESAAYREDGFVIVLSGSELEERSWAVVGFIIAPWCIRRVKSYRQISDRTAYIKVKVTDGTVGIITAYAPHNMRPLAQRVHFHAELDEAFQKCSANQGKFICGGMNSRIGQPRPGENDIFGAHGYGREAVHEVERPNRDLLFEFCGGEELLVASTFIDEPPDRQVTHREPGASPLGLTTEQKYNLLDLVLCEKTRLDQLGYCHSVRQAALGTDQYLVLFGTQVTAMIRASG